MILWTKALWEPYPTKFKEKISAAEGSEEKAKTLATWIALTDYLTHEIVHQYQDSTLPGYFLEFGARYYQRQLTDNLKIGHILEDLAEKRILIYKELIDQFGEDVHKIFFGKQNEVDETKKLAILAKSWIKGPELFPEGI